MQRARAFHLLELFANIVDALADDAAVGLDLSFAGTAEKAEAATLPLQMRPRANQAALLIGEMGELDLQAPFPRPRAPTEDLEDQSGTVEHFRAPGGFQIALLHRRELVIDDDKFGLLGADQSGKLLDLAGAEQCRRLRFLHRDDAAGANVEIDGGGETDGFGEARGRAPLLRFLSLRSFPAVEVDDRRENDGARRLFARKGLARILGGTLLLS